MTSTTRLALAFLLAAPAAPVLAKGDAEAGHLKVYTCSGCHGIPGYKNVYPHYSVPRIGGQNYEYLLAALKSYRSGERKHPTMRAQAEGFTEQDLEDISAYLSSLGGDAAKQ